MINPTTGWYKIIQYNDKYADTIANLVEQAWICRYPRPKIIMYDHCNGFICHAIKNNPIQK